MPPTLRKNMDEFISILINHTTDTDPNLRVKSFSGLSSLNESQAIYFNRYID